MFNFFRINKMAVLGLLSVAVIPGIALARALYAHILAGLTSKSRESHANAGIIAKHVGFTNSIQVFLIEFPSYEIC